jgi:hypothetical protein
LKFLGIQYHFSIKMYLVKVYATVLEFVRVALVDEGEVAKVNSLNAKASNSCRLDTKLMARIQYIAIGVCAYRYRGPLEVDSFR